MPKNNGILRNNKFLDQTSKFANLPCFQPIRREDGKVQGVTEISQEIFQ